ncbi:MAG: YdbL family protein [Sphingomonas fennica]
MRGKTIGMLAAAALAIAAAGAAYAQAEGGVVAQARAAGQVGEQSDGYLGFATTPSPDVKAAVDAINIKRRQIYTDIAARQGATVQEVAAARGCAQLTDRVRPGEAYRAGGNWAVRQGNAPVVLPAVCG